MAQFLSLWLFSLCGTFGVVGVAGYCFRGDIPAEPFLIEDFFEDAVKSCTSCGINATRESTLLAREQLDVATFFANSSLNCLCLLNDVYLTAELWHKGGKLPAKFPHLTKPADNNSLVHFPWADRTVCMTSPSNLTLTSSPRLGFVKESFTYSNPREPLGFSFDHGDNDGVNMMIFDSLQLDNVFKLEGPWLLLFALPIGFVGLGNIFPDIGNEELESRSWSITVAIHNSVAYGFCSDYKDTIRWARTVFDVFDAQVQTDRKIFVNVDAKDGIANIGVNCDPDNILACLSRNSFMACCEASMMTTRDARQCIMEQTRDAHNYDWISKDTDDFLRNSACGSGDSSEENEHCPLPLDACEAAKCCLKTDPLTQRQTCVYRVANYATIYPDTVEDAGGNDTVLILAGLGSVAVGMTLAATAFLRFDAKRRTFRVVAPCFRGRVFPPDLPLHQDLWERSLMKSEGMPVVEELVQILMSSKAQKKVGLQGFRESRDVFLHNLEDCYLPISNGLACLDEVFSVEPEPSEKQIVKDSASATPDLKASTHQGLIMEAKGIIQGYDNTYYIIKSLHGGCQAACYLVSTETDGERCYFAAKVFSSRQILSSAVSEAYILAQAKHANILEIIETFADQGSLVIITRFCEFGDLGTLIDLSQKHGVGVEETWIMEVLVQLCLALRHLHRTCIIHRDLKPGNIFMDKHGTVKIGDFGLSKMTTTHLAETIVGTPYFMAPEINRGTQYSFSSDVWSLGVIVYYMCTNKMPFDGDSVLELEEKKNVGVYDMKAMAGFSSGLVDLVTQMLRSDPTKRPTAEEILGFSCIRETVANLRQQILARQQ